MTKTANLGLSLVLPSQAQKHVTVNEAFARLDGLCQMRLASVTETTPPGSAAEGVAYGVPSSAEGEWAEHEGEVAIFSNGGWAFVAPKTGWRAFVQDVGANALHDGVEWVINAVATSQGGAASLFEVLEFDHIFSAGVSQQTNGVIPAGASVLGVSGRVIEDVTGSLASWRVGVEGSPDRYGTGLGTTAGSWLQGMTGHPTTYYTDTPLLLTAEGGEFASGRLRIAFHIFRLRYPRA